MGLAETLIESEISSVRLNGYESAFVRARAEQTAFLNAVKTPIEIKSTGSDFSLRDFISKSNPKIDYRDTARSAWRGIKAGGAATGRYAAIGAALGIGSAIVDGVVKHYTDNRPAPLPLDTSFIEIQKKNIDLQDQMNMALWHLTGETAANGAATKLALFGDEKNYGLLESIEGLWDSQISIQNTLVDVVDSIGASSDKIVESVSNLMQAQSSIGGLISASVDRSSTTTANSAGAVTESISNLMQAQSSLAGLISFSVDKLSTATVNATTASLDKLVKPLSDIAAKPSVDVALQAESLNLQKAYHTAHTEALDFAKTAQEHVVGDETVTVSPRQAQMTKSIQDTKLSKDQNDFEIEDDDLNDSLLSTLLPYSGVAGSFSAVSQLFPTGDLPSDLIPDFGTDSQIINLLLKKIGGGI